MGLLIGLSYAPQDMPKYRAYRDALERTAREMDEVLEVVDLSTHPDRIDELDGIVFTGGADIDPARYGKAEELTFCEPIDAERDATELEYARSASERKIPVLGICRGAQLLNVSLGGTLVTDIEHFGGGTHTKVGSRDQRHPVRVEPGTLIRRIVREGEGEVNSAHHQAVERLGEGLVASARGLDGTVEAIEWADPTGRPYLLAVQWHPERMDFEEDFAHPIFESFLFEVAAHHVLRSRVAKTPVEGN